VGYRGVAAVAAALALPVLCALGAISPGVAAAAGVTFDSAPPAQSNQTTGTFVFHPTGQAQGTGTFTCALDGGAMVSPCPSPHTVSGLSEGLHRFVVTLVGTGVAQTGESDWTVDLTPPITQVTGKPPALSSSTTSTFTFTSPDPTATFRCSLNGATATACSSPVTFSGLADATRSFLVQAVDPAGNVDTQAQPINWTVDTTAPDTKLTNPGNIVGNDVAVFQFTSTEAGSTFQCSFRSAPFTACTSPASEDVPHSGAQVFKVRAVDAAGNVDATPAVYTWTSDLTPPKKPKITIFPAPSAHASTVAPSARASAVKPRPVAEKAPPLTLTFTSPLSALLRTPVFTLGLRLHAQWSSDTTVKSYEVTVDTFPMDSTGMGFHGEDLDYHREYHATKRTALTLNMFPGGTVCVKVDATDKVGNTSKTTLSCTTVPVSFTPRDIGPPPVKDAKAFRGYYIILGAKGYEFVQDIGDQFFFTPTHAALVAEHCPTCGTVEFDFDRFVGNPKNKLHKLATVNLTSSHHSGDFDLINVSLPVHRLERDGSGDLVIRATSGKPRISGIGVAN
jgi:hypothetical protein